MTADRESELKGMINHLVESSVKAHMVLRSPSPTMTLVESAGHVMDTLERYESALRSIAASSCCDRCNEAKLVAQFALRPPAEAGG